MNVEEGADEHCRDTSQEDRERLRRQVIAKYGQALELIAEEAGTNRSRHRRRKGPRKCERGRDG